MPSTVNTRRKPPTPRNSPIREPRLHLERRFLEKVQRAKGDCWIWDGAMAGPYGVMRNEEQQRELAHLISYRLYVSDAKPEGWDVDHICEEQLCVNPDHLRVIPHADNVYRKTRLRCKSGHERTDENTYIAKNGSRTCKVCQSNYNRRKNSAKPKSEEQREAARKKYGLVNKHQPGAV